MLVNLRVQRVRSHCRWEQCQKNCLQYLGYLFIYLYDRHFKFWIDTHVFKSYFDFSKDDKCLGGD